MRIRFAFNRTAVHRTNADTFGAPDVGINIFSYMPKCALMTVNQRVFNRRRHGERGDVRHQYLPVQR